MVGDVLGAFTGLRTIPEDVLSQSHSRKWEDSVWRGEMSAEKASSVVGKVE